MAKFYGGGRIGETFDSGKPIPSRIRSGKPRKAASQDETEKENVSRRARTVLLHRFKAGPPQKVNNTLQQSRKCISEPIVDVSSRLFGGRKDAVPNVVKPPGDGENSEQKTEDGTDDAARHAGDRQSVKIAEMATRDHRKDDGKDAEDKTQKSAATADKRQDAKDEGRDGEGARLWLREVAECLEGVIGATRPAPALSVFVKTVPLKVEGFLSGLLPPFCGSILRFVVLRIFFLKIPIHKTSFPSRGSAPNPDVSTIAKRCASANHRLHYIIPAR